MGKALWKLVQFASILPLQHLRYLEAGTKLLKVGGIMRGLVTREARAVFGFLTYLTGRNA